MSQPTTSQEHDAMQSPVSILLRFLTKVTTVVVTLTVAVALAPEGVRAATYELEQCTVARPGYSGWTPSFSGSYVYSGQNCAEPDGALFVSFNATLPHDNGNFVFWRFTPPADTSLASIAVDHREFRSGASNPAGYGDASVVVLRNNGSQTVEDCTRVLGCTTMAGARTYPLDGASDFWFGLQCTGANGCPADDAHARFSGIRTRLNDTTNPVLSTVSGSLTSTTTTTRVRQLFFTATDKGGGVYRRRLIVDGQAQPPLTVSTNSGACVQPFNTRVPCPLSISSQFDVDTATLVDGAHDIALRITDATDQNVAQSATWSIKVDNRPPAVGEPAISGTPSEGATLTCAAAVAGEAPAVTYQWLRANGDGSDPVAIDGANAATYAVSATDVGRKLICRVSATDGGGSTTRDSVITQPPFDNGRLVTPAGVLESTSLGAIGTVRFVLTKETLTFARRRARWTTSAFTARGRLTDPSGNPVGGLRLTVSQTIIGRRLALGATTTAPDGSWSIRIPRGPSRTIIIAAADATNAATTTIQQRVNASVAIRALRKRIRRGGTVLFRGTLRGGYANTREKLVEFQVHYRGAWRTIATLNVDKRGRFAVRYRFGAAAYGRYSFRARTLPTFGYPFSVGVSRGRAARVRVG